MPIYGEFVPPSPSAGAVLGSGPAGGVASWTLSVLLGEIATPANPAANNIKIYARDNGLASPNNRTQLIVLWSDGTESVVAESPAS